MTGSTPLTEPDSDGLTGKGVTGVTRQVGSAAHAFSRKDDLTPPVTPVTPVTLGDPNSPFSDESARPPVDQQEAVDPDGEGGEW